MALIKCRDCGHDVSSSAVKCEHCGKLVVTSGARTVWIIAALLLAVLMAVVATQG